MTSPFAIAVLTPEKRKEVIAGHSRAQMETDFLAELGVINMQHEHHERLAFLVIDGEPWTTNNGLLTPTLKVRRNFIEERYSSRFEEWAKGGQQVIWLETRG